jgi:hypothetical protein
MPRGIRIQARAYHEDGKGVTLTWRAPSLDALMKFVDGNLRGTLVGKVVPIRFDPDPPVITSVFPFSVIQPNGGVIIQGVNFGESPGQFIMNGSEFAGGSISLGSLTWNETVIGGVIPNIFGVRDQQVTLQVITNTGQRSNAMPVQFTAAREVQALPADIFQVGISDSSVVGYADPPITFEYYHFDDIPVVDMFTGNSGTDYFTTDLKNGWVYYSYQWTLETSGVQGGPFGPDPEPVGQAHIELAISWSYGPLSSAQYGITIYGIGPVGVPYQ